MEKEPHEEHWTPELLAYLLAWLDLILELPKNKELIDKIKKSNP